MQATCAGKNKTFFFGSGGKKTTHVVATIPDDDVGFLLSFSEDAAVVDTGINGGSLLDVHLVLLALLDGDLVLLEVGVAGEALDRLLCEVTVRHRVTDGDWLQSRVAEQLCDVPRRLALAAPSAHGDDGDDGFARLDPRVLRPEHGKVGACAHHAVGDVHDRLVVQVAVRQDATVGVELPDLVLELGLGPDRQALRVQWARQLRRVKAALDLRDLRRSEPEDLVLGVLPEENVEVVEVTPSGT